MKGSDERKRKSIKKNIAKEIDSDECLYSSDEFHSKRYSHSQNQKRYTAAKKRREMSFNHIDQQHKTMINKNSCDSVDDIHDKIIVNNRKKKPFSERESSSYCSNVDKIGKWHRLNELISNLSRTYPKKAPGVKLNIFSPTSRSPRKLRNRKSTSLQKSQSR